MNNHVPSFEKEKQPIEILRQRFGVVVHAADILLSSVESSLGPEPDQYAQQVKNAQDQVLTHTPPEAVPNIHTARMQAEEFSRQNPIIQASSDSGAEWERAA
jgi:hypothetical protein